MLAVDPLDEQVNSAAVALTPPHVFEIVTSSVTYYVGVDMTGFSPADLKSSNSTEDEGVLHVWEALDYVYVKAQCDLNLVCLLVITEKPAVQ